MNCSLLRDSRFFPEWSKTESPKYIFNSDFASDNSNQRFFQNQLVVLKHCGLWNPFEGLNRSQSNTNSSKRYAVFSIGILAFFFYTFLLTEFLYLVSPNDQKVINNNTSRRSTELFSWHEQWEYENCRTYRTHFSWVWLVTRWQSKSITFYGSDENFEHWWTNCNILKLWSHKMRKKKSIFVVCALLLSMYVHSMRKF